MKKILSILMTIALLAATFTMLLPVSAAGTSPVKAYDTANYGELLYTVNFQGDAAFAPQKRATQAQNTGDNMNYSISSDGKALTVVGKAPGTDLDSYWGAKIEGLTLGAKAMYTMKYQVNAKASAVKNNSTGFGGLILFEGVDNSVPQFYNNYSRHNAVTLENRRAAISNNGVKQEDYVMWSTLAKEAKEDADGYITMLNVFDISRDTYTTYYLAADDTWQKISSFEMLLDETDRQDGSLGFMLYAFYGDIDTTVKNVEFYKGDMTNPTLRPEGEPADTGNGGATGGDTTGGDTTGGTTTGGDTTNNGNTNTNDTTTTAAPETTAPKAEEKKGCGGSIGLAGLALVATVATVGVVAKKKED